MVPERVECASLFMSLGVVKSEATIVVHDEVFFVGRLIVFHEVGEIEAFVPFFVLASKHTDFSIIGPLRRYEDPFSAADVFIRDRFPRAVVGVMFGWEVYFADLFAEVSFPLSGVEWYPGCRIVELPPLVVIIV